MIELSIALDGDRAAFAPGEEIRGSASWSADASTRNIELRLFWFTRGKGTEDAGIVETLSFDQPLPHETRSFCLRLPTAPYSCSGQLISIVWALELVASPGKTVVRREIEVGPGGKEVRLQSVNRPPDASRRWFTVQSR
jgi:hypothetical protein